MNDIQTERSADDWLRLACRRGSDAEHALARFFGCVKLDWARYARNILEGRSDLLEPALQNALLTLWRKSDGDLPQENLRAWSFGVLRFECLQVLRKAKEAFAEPTAQEPIAPGAGPATTIRRKDEDEHLTRALRALPEGELAAIELRFLGNCSVAEIARTLAVPENTVWDRINRGLQRLRQKHAAFAHCLNLIDCFDVCHLFIFETAQRAVSTIG